MTIHFYGKNLGEIAEYFPEKINRDQLVDLMTELTAWRAAAAGMGNCALDTPEELTDYVDAIEVDAAGCNLADHSDYEDLKEFFNDTVDAMCEISGAWPGAEAYDLNLRAAVIDCIEKGAEIIEAEREQVNK